MGKKLLFFSLNITEQLQKALKWSYLNSFSYCICRYLTFSSGIAMFWKLTLYLIAEYLKLQLILVMKPDSLINFHTDLELSVITFPEKKKFLILYAFFLFLQSERNGSVTENTRRITDIYSDLCSYNLHVFVVKDLLSQLLCRVQ